MGDSVDFGQMARFFEKMSLNFDEIAIEYILENKDKYLDANRSNLDQAINADGTKLEQSYSEFTKAYKRFKGQPTDRITRKDTGAFYESIEIVKNGSAVEFVVDNSAVPYYNEPNGLYDRYGEALGLPLDQFQELFHDFKVHFIELIRGTKTTQYAA